MLIRNILEYIIVSHFYVIMPQPFMGLAGGGEGVVIACTENDKIYRAIFNISSYILAFLYVKSDSCYVHYIITIAVTIDIDGQTIKITYCCLFISKLEKCQNCLLFSDILTLSRLQ